MLTYRLVFRPRSATLTPWQADTLFGHLCWLLLYREGEDELEKLLDACRQGSPPLLFSNGFPGDLLPRPMLPLAPRPPADSKEKRIKLLQEAKEAKKERLVSLADFNALRHGEAVQPVKQPAMVLAQTVLKNQINRLTGGTTALDEGASSGKLYALEELAFARKEGQKRLPVEFSVYLRAEDETWAGKARSLLEELSSSGYGKKKSSGYGQFALLDMQPFDGFDEVIPSANGFVSLSNWSPAADDPTGGFYTPLVKYGKLGEAFAALDNPFKFPLVMLQAGSAFYTLDAVKPFYGRLVEGIAPGAPQAVQYGFAFAVPAYLYPQE